MAVFAVLLALVGGPAIPSAETEIIYDLSRLSPVEAVRLEGTRVKFRIRLDSTEGKAGGFVIYDVLAKDDVFGSVWMCLYPGQVIDDDMIVEARLVIIHHKAFPGVHEGFTEYRLVRPANGSEAAPRAFFGP
jgi:hypothetical protein